MAKRQLHLHKVQIDSCAQFIPKEVVLAKKSIDERPNDIIIERSLKPTKVSFPDHQSRRYFPHKQSSLNCTPSSKYTNASISRTSTLSKQSLNSNYLKMEDYIRSMKRDCNPQDSLRRLQINRISYANYQALWDRNLKVNYNRFPIRTPTVKNNNAFKFYMNTSIRVPRQKEEDMKRSTVTVKEYKRKEYSRKQYRKVESCRMKPMHPRAQSMRIRRKMPSGDLPSPWQTIQDEYCYTIE